jgi:transcriptional regulator of acetoin/glycerol metabolism
VDTTREPQPDAEAPPPRSTWDLVVAYHPDPARVGTRLELRPGASLAVRRGEGLFEDRTISRRHARISAGPSTLEIEDEGSRYGTFVNGEPVQRQPLKAHDVINVGELLLLVGAGEGSPGAALAAEIENVARLATPVLFTGETGAGKGHFARALNDASGRAPLVVLACGAVPAEGATEELFGADDRPGLLERADGGTLLLDDVDEAPRGVHAALLGFLDDGAARRVGAVEARRLDVRIVATARRPEALPGEFVSRLRLVLRVPPLRERLEELPVIVRGMLAARGMWARRALVFALMKHSYRHNVRELEGLVERAAIDAGDEKVAGLSKGVAEAMGLTDVAAPGALVVAGDGSWFRAPGASRVSLARRETLARLLEALVTAHRERPGRELSTDDLFAAGWPGERIKGPAATGRVYVALTALRNLGLRDFLTRGETGYLLDPSARIETAPSG